MRIAKRIGLVVAFVALAGCLEEQNKIANLDTSGMTPRWEAIAAWPGRSEEGGASPDADRDILVVILDDSGSMEGGRLEAAKAGITEVVAKLDDDDRVGVIGINTGQIVAMTEARWARGELAGALPNVPAAGGTMLGATVRTAYQALEQEAARHRGFGRYRILVATDGAAGDGETLVEAVSEIVANTPIDVTTIGIGLGVGHVLNIPGFTRYVAVDRLEDLATAMRVAAAEQPAFEPITSFREGSP